MTQPASTSDPLPAPLLRALDQIAAELNDMPRECARDHGALCLWKGRIARRVRALKEMRVSPRVLRVVVPVEVKGSGKRKAQPGRAKAQMEMTL